MKKFSVLIAIIAITTFLAGCPKKQTIVKDEAAAPAVNKNTQADAEDKSKKEAEARAKADAEARAKMEAQEKERAEAGKKARTETAKFRVEDIHFDYDRSDIREKDREALKSTAEWLLNNKGSKIQIEGHCDERGNDAYNLALGDRRAHSIKQYLATLGISPSRISTITYGKEKPLCTESNEACWWKNRRGHFNIQDAKLTNR